MTSIYNFFFEDKHKHNRDYNPNIIHTDTLIGEQTSFDMSTNELGSSIVKQKVNKCANFLTVGLIGIAIHEGVQIKTNGFKHDPTLGLLASIGALGILVATEIVNRYIDSAYKKNV